jgi:hypothetical protein
MRFPEKAALRPVDGFIRPRRFGPITHGSYQRFDRGCVRPGGL